MTKFYLYFYSYFTLYFCTFPKENLKLRKERKNGVSFLFSLQKFGGYTHKYYLPEMVIENNKRCCIFHRVLR